MLQKLEVNGIIQNFACLQMARGHDLLSTVDWLANCYYSHLSLVECMLFYFMFCLLCFSTMVYRYCSGLVFVLISDRRYSTENQPHFSDPHDFLPKIEEILSIPTVPVCFLDFLSTWEVSSYNKLSRKFMISFIWTKNKIKCYWHIWYQTHSDSNAVLEDGYLYIWVHAVNSNNLPSSIDCST